MSPLPKHYDYIIAGAGCAGMSLLMRMMNDPFFGDKKILVIDRSPKTTNDRTWCFWEKTPGIFEPVVTHRWVRIAFYAKHYSSEQSTGAYEYKMIRGIDLYDLVKQRSTRFSNIEWKVDTVISVENAGSKAILTTEMEIFTTEWIFSSLLFTDTLVSAKKTDHHLWQHFTGWMIKTDHPCFDPGLATYMDFRINQNKGTAFMYVLPVSENQALVEYTLFTDTLLASGEYEAALKNYIHDTIGTADYRIIHTEQGVIPMTNQRFPLQDGRIVYMGTAGGQVKGSSGYAFQFIQKRTDAVIGNLLKGGSRFDQRTAAERKFRFYDGVLLNVLTRKKMSGEAVFTAIFENNTPERVFAFLDNETGIGDDLAIMGSVPSSLFIPAALQQLFT